MCMVIAAQAGAAGPMAWSGAVNVDGANTIESLDCHSPTFCLAGDLAGNVVAINPSTGSKVVTALPAAGTVINVACPSTTLCLAVESSNVWWSTDPGAPAPTWSSAALSAPLQLE